MCTTAFKYEDDLLKHYIRTEAWLPLCRRRLRSLRNQSTAKTMRRLRYFTFCAVGAIDVLMLDVEKVLVRSDSRGFDTVCFFDKSRECVLETQKRIPGAIGFPGDFTQIVLADDPDEDDLLNGQQSLEPIEVQEDVYESRRAQLELATRREFVRHFPFDVINLDLEEFLFKPRDPRPGKVINAMRKVFQWQRNKFRLTNAAHRQQIDGFSLMFTTQIGPPSMSEDYSKMLLDCISDNMKRNRDLAQPLIARAGISDAAVLLANDFDLFFKLAMPKLIASALMEEDWYVDPEPGIAIFEFERPSKDGPYKLLHLIMDVKRHWPPRDKRAPGAMSTVAEQAYQEVILRLFKEPEQLVTNDVLDGDKLRLSLERIKGRRRKYYPD
jgi:hypothetical protein